VDEAESELERQEVKVRKGRKLKKEVCVEAGKEESLENKKQIDTSVSEALLKVLEILPADTKAFLQPLWLLLQPQRKESLKRFLLKFKLQRNRSP
jgi:hypothetical protein